MKTTIRFAIENNSGQWFYRRSDGSAGWGCKQVADLFTSTDDLPRHIDDLELEIHEDYSSTEQRIDARYYSEDSEEAEAGVRVIEL